MRVNCDLRPSSVSGQGNAVRPNVAQDGLFESRLKAEVQKQDVRLSAHAQKRLAERNVELADSDKARLGEGVDKMAEKGADKSLVLLDNLAFVVSAKNRVVITAMDSQNTGDSVFTGIEGAVIV